MSKSRKKQLKQLQSLTPWHTGTQEDPAGRISTAPRGSARQAQPDRVPLLLATPVAGRGHRCRAFRAADEALSA